MVKEIFISTSMRSINVMTQNVDMILLDGKTERLFVGLHLSPPMKAILELVMSCHHSGLVNEVSFALPSRSSLWANLFVLNRTGQEAMRDFAMNVCYEAESIYFGYAGGVLPLRKLEITDDMRKYPSDRFYRTLCGLIEERLIKDLKISFDS